jgi:hypothetical protein
VSGRRVDDRIDLIQVALRVGFSCAVTALVVVAVFFIIRYMAGAD